MKKIGIYGIRSLSHPNRFYIGSSVNIIKRWELHRNNLRLNKHHSQKLQRHFNKYGFDDLKFEIILRCDRENLLQYEQAFIDLYKPYFNINPTAGSNAGIRVSETTKRKMREAQLGKRHSEETLKKLGDARRGEKNWIYGKTVPDNVREKISNTLMGHPVSDETKKKQQLAREKRKARLRAQERKPLFFFDIIKLE